MVHIDLCTISKITNNIYLSGIIPINDNINTIKDLNIKYILACVDTDYINYIHNKILMENPNIVVLYLPYNDSITQNLWLHNNDIIKIFKYTKCIADNNKLTCIREFYKNKPLIEIAYHFIDNAVNCDSSILIHCMAGKSRSVSVIAYYLMKKYNLQYEYAISYIKNHRSIASPNKSFANQLMYYHIKRAKFVVADAQQIILSVNNLKI